MTYEEARRKSQEKLLRTKAMAFQESAKRYGATYGDNYLSKSVYRSPQEIADYYNATEKQLKGLTTMRDYINLYGNDEQKASLADMDKAITEINTFLGGRDKVSSYYGAFDNADAYAAYLQQEAQEKARDERLKGTDTDALAAEILKDAQDQPKVKSWFNITGGNGRYSNADANQQERLRDYEDAVRLQGLERLNAAVSRADFEEKSKVDPTIDNDLYRTINGLPSLYQSYAMPNKLGGYNPTSKEYDMPYTDQMTDQERSTYNFWAKENPEEAQKYFEYLTPTLAQRASNEFAQFGETAPIASTILSILATPAAAIEQPFRMVDGGYNTASLFSTSARSGVTKDMGDVGSFFYNTAVSGAESLATAKMFGNAGSAILGLSAAGSTQNDILLRGGTQKQAVLGGMSAGIAEMFFESFSISQLNAMKPKDIVRNFKVFAANLAKETGTNAMEETLTEISNIISDTAIMGEISNLSLSVAQYEAMGNSRDKATKMAINDLAKQVGEAAASGALMGFGFSAIGGTSGLAQNYSLGSQSVKGDFKNIGSINSEDALIARGNILFENAKGETKAENARIADANALIKNVTENKGKKTVGQKLRVGALMEAVNTESIKEGKTDVAKYLNVQKATETARSEAENAEVKSGGDIRRSAVPKVVKIDGDKLSQIYVEQDGEAVSLEDMTFDNADIAEAFSLASNFGSVAVANSFMENYISNMDNVTPTEFWTAWAGIMTDGQTLRTDEKLMADVFGQYTDRISTEAKTAAWLAGVENKKGFSEKRRAEVAKIKEEWEKGGKKVKAGTYDDSALKGVKLDKQQKEFVAFARIFSDVFGMNVKLIATKKGARGDDNGSYNRTTNTITLDIFAGIGNNDNYNAVQLAVANTLSHEVVHNMREVAYAQYEALQEYVFEVLRARGVDTDELVRYYMNHDKLSRNDAIEEVVAHSCDGMLATSATAREFMSGFYAKNKKAANKFTEFIRSVLKRLKAVFDSFAKRGAYDLESQVIAKAGKSAVEQLQKLYDAGILALREGNLAKNATLGMVSEGATITPDGTVMLQQRQYRETGRASVLEYLTEQYGADTANDMIDTMDKLYAVVDEIKDENPELDIFSQWQETEVELDEEGHPIFTSDIKNGDYVLNQNFSRVCKKRRQLDEVLNWLTSHKDFDVAYLTKDDYKKINDIIRKHGFEVACDLCFVDAKRFRQSEWAESFADTWNNLLDSITVSGTATPFNFATEGTDVSATDIVIDESRPISYNKFEDGKIKGKRSYANLSDFFSKDKNSIVKLMMRMIVENPEYRHHFRSADIISSKGFDEIQRKMPELRQILNGWGGSSAPKSSSLDAVYDNSILNIKGYNKEAAYAVGGVRMNSFSDFIAHMFFDYCQAFADLAAKELPMQAYSKELTFFLLYGRTGGKLNMSGIPAPRGGAHSTLNIEKQFAGLDVAPLAEYLGKPIKDLTTSDCLKHLDMLEYLWAKESIDIKKATLLQSGIRFDKLSDEKIDKCYDLIRQKKFDEAHSVAGRENVDLEYTKNIGIVAVGVSEPHIRKLLRDHTIRMVIPYHSSGINPNIAKAMRIYSYMNYTDFQSTTILFKGEKKAVKLKKKDHKIDDFNFYDYFGKTIDGVFYDAKATANRYIEWCREMSTDEYTIIPKFNQFTNEENYYKLLEDFDCYNTITEAHEAQGAVDFFGDTLPADYKDIITKELKQEQKNRDDFRAELDGTEMREEILGVVRNRGFNVEAEEMKQTRHDSDYLSSVERGDKATMERLVAETARQNGYDTPKLYHGTNTFGFTRFDTSRGLGLIYATTNPAVAANYGGKANYAGVREIGKRYISPDTVEYWNDQTKAVIQNAETVFGSKYKVLTDSVREETRAKVYKEATEIASKLDSAFADFNLDEDLANAMTWVTDLFYTVQENDAEFFSDDAESRAWWLSSLKDSIRHFNENYPKLREYLENHFDEFNDSQKRYARVLRSYELTDAAVDIEYSYYRAANPTNEIQLVNAKTNTNIVTRDELQERVDSARNIGAYALYGKLGSNPLIVDANGKDWVVLTVPEIGDGKYHSTDYIANWAKENNYTSVVVRNVYDGGELADDYIFFEGAQVKSADPITYDDNGNVIPLSERFDEKRDDILYQAREKNLDKFEIMSYNEIELPFIEMERLQSEAMRWNVNKRNVFLTSTLSNGYTYRYYIDDDGIAHVFSAKKAINIHEGDYGNDNTNNKESYEIVEELRTQSPSSRGGNMLGRNGREQTRNDRYDHRPIRREGDSDRAGYPKDRNNSDRNIKIRDEEYLNAVNKGDFETAKSMVLLEAKENGYTYDVYHGTGAGRFTVFNPRRGIFLATSKRAATNFAYGNDKYVYHLAAKLEDPFIVDLRREGKYPNFERIPVPKKMGDEGYPKVVSTEDIAAWAYRNGYDGVVIYGITQNYNDITDEVIVFDSNQVKSLDPVTYDEDGNIIPLSERFDESRDDILHQKRIETPSPSALLKAVIRSNERYKHYGKYTESLKKYQDLDVRIRAAQERVSEIDKEINDIKKKPAKQQNAKRLSELYERKQRESRTITEYRNRQFAMESNELRNIVANETAIARQETQKNEREQFRAKEQARRVRANATNNRRKLMRIVHELDKLLNRGNKKKHVKSGLRSTVETSLRLAQLLTFEQIGNDEVILLDDITIETDTERKYINEYRDLLDERNRIDGEIEKLYNENGADVAQKIEALSKDRDDVQGRINYRAGKLKDLLEREKNRLGKVKVGAILQELEDEYNALKDAEESYIRDMYNDFLAGRISALKDGLKDVYVKKMTEAELQEIVDLYNAILKTVKGANKAFLAEKNMTIQAMAEDTRVDALAKGEKDRDHVIFSTIRGFFTKNLTPTWFFEFLDSKTMTMLAKNLAQAEGEWAKTVREAAEFKERTDEKYGVGEWDVNKTFTFDSKTGKTFEVTLEQLMSIYAYSKQGEEAERHLDNGGIVHAKSILVSGKKPVKNKDGKKINIKMYKIREGAAYKLSPEIRGEMIEELKKNAPKVTEYIDEMVGYLSSDLAKIGNATAEKLYGMEIFNNPYYFPIKSSEFWIRSKQEAQKGTVELKNWGATKERVPNASNPIVLDNFTDVWARHCLEMASFATMTLALEDMNRVFNYSERAGDDYDASSVRGTISRVYGSDYAEYIANLINQLNGGARSDDNVPAVDLLMSLAKAGATAGSLSVIVQQPTAIARAFAYINPKYFLTKPLTLKTLSSEWEELKKYAPVAIIKEMGGYDTGVGKKTTSYINAKQYNTFKERAKGLVTDSAYRNEAIYYLPSKADELTWSYLWQAVKNEIADTTDLKRGTEEFLKACGERYEDIVRHTQVYDSMFARSELMRMKGTFARMATAFAAEPTLTMNMVAYSFKSGNKKMFASAMTSMLLNAAVVSLVYAARDDDEDETYAEKYIEALTGEILEGINPITYIPIIRDIWSIFLGYDVERLDMSAVADIWKAFEGLFSSRKTPYEKWTDFVGQIALFLGIPVKNLLREGEAVYNMIRMMIELAEGNHTDAEGILEALKEGAENAVPMGEKIFK